MSGSDKGIQDISLKTETEKRYLNYALSVITSRALPDVRDGLKPVQRRILYGMFSNLKLLPNAKYRKSAAVVGEVMGKYHPHGDQAIYDAMVRMAQDFSLRYPLVDGYGNFGSLDGDKAAAMRYTEARLREITLDLLQELKQNTVDFQDSFDGTNQEPIVLPSRFPNILVNGSSGIAVGMATNIPPHNFNEVMDAFLYLLDHPDADIAQLLKLMKGPDFPTGGEITTPKKDRIAIYEKGQGSFSVRGTWKEEKGSSKKTKNLIVTSVPYGVQKSSLVEKIADVIVSKKLPMLLDIRDESTEDVRVVLEAKKDADPELVMAYLYKHTNLEQKFSLNMTCLCPQSGVNIPTPSRLSLKDVLLEFRNFRQEVLRRRFTFELEKLQRRIHILRGFKIVFESLDEVLDIIRSSDGKKDSAQKLLARFALDEEQVEAILETKLYRLSKLEISNIVEELEGCEKAAAEIEAILGDPQRILDVLKKECQELREKYPKKRRTKIRERDKAPVFEADDFLQHDETYVIVTESGWIKRLKSFNSVDSIRVKENDRVLSVVPTNTKHTVGFLTNTGTIYTMKIWDIPATTGYGTPMQSIFNFKDQETLLSVFCFDTRVFGNYGTPVFQEVGGGASIALPGQQTQTSVDKAFSPEPPYHLCIVSKSGMGLRISAENFVEPSTKNGRRCIRLSKEDEVIAGFRVSGYERLILASEKARLLLFPIEEVKFLSNAGKGVSLMQLEAKDSLYAAATSNSLEQGLDLIDGKGKNVRIAPENTRVAKRNTKGVKKKGISSWEGRLFEPKIEEIAFEEIKIVPRPTEKKAKTPKKKKAKPETVGETAETLVPSMASEQKEAEVSVPNRESSVVSEVVVPKPVKEKADAVGQEEREELLGYAPKQESYEEKKRRLMEELSLYSWDSSNEESKQEEKKTESIGFFGNKQK